MRAESSDVVRPAAVTAPMYCRRMMPCSSICTPAVIGSGMPSREMVIVSPGRSWAFSAGAATCGLAPVEATGVALSEAQPARKKASDRASSVAGNRRKRIRCLSSDGLPGGWQQRVFVAAGEGGAVRSTAAHRVGAPCLSVRRLASAAAALRLLVLFLGVVGIVVLVLLLVAVLVLIV